MYLHDVKPKKFGPIEIYIYKFMCYSMWRIRHIFVRQKQWKWIAIGVSIRTGFKGCNIIVRINNSFSKENKDG